MNGILTLVVIVLQLFQIQEGSEGNSFEHICLKRVPVKSPELRKVSIPINQCDFKSFVTKSDVFFDRTELIKILVTNPFKGRVVFVHTFRRNGKTMVLNMLKYFFQPEVFRDETKKLEIRQPKESWSYDFFKNGKIIENDNELIRPPKISHHENIINDYLGKYPVVYLDFSGTNLQGFSFQDCLCKIKDRINEAFASYRMALLQLLDDKDGKYDLHTQRKWYQMVNFFMSLCPGDSPINGTDLQSGMLVFCEMLKEFYGNKVILLVDEYERPLFTAFKGGVNPETRLLNGFFKQFYNDLLKKDSHIKQAFLIGIFDVTAGIKGSAVNHAIRILNGRKKRTKRFGYLQDFFGVAEFELKDVLEAVNLGEEYENAKFWYDGYNIKGSKRNSYNLISIVETVNCRKIANFWQDIAMKPYFLKLFRYSWFRDDVLIDILRGKGIAEPLYFKFRDLNDVKKVFDLLEHKKDANYIMNPVDKSLITFYLLSLGYLSYKSIDYDENKLQIPNREILSQFFKEFILYEKSLNPKYDVEAVNANVGKAYHHWLVNPYHVTVEAFKMSVEELIKVKIGTIGTDASKFQESGGDLYQNVIRYAFLSTLSFYMHEKYTLLPIVKEKDVEPDLAVYSKHFLSVIELVFPENTSDKEALFLSGRTDKNTTIRTAVEGTAQTLKNEILAKSHPKNYESYFCSIGGLRDRIDKSVHNIRGVGILFQRNGSVQFHFQNFTFDAKNCN